MMSWMRINVAAVVVVLGTVATLHAGEIRIVQRELPPGLEAAYADLAVSDILISTSAGEMIGALQLHAELTEGSIFQHALGSNFGVSPSVLDLAPGLEFDSRIASGALDSSFTPLIAGPSIDFGIGGKSAVFTSNAIDLTFGPQPGQHTGGVTDFLVARLAYRKDAVGSMRFAADFSGDFASQTLEWSIAGGLPSLISHVFTQPPLPEPIHTPPSPATPAPYPAPEAPLPAPTTESEYSRDPPVALPPAMDPVIVPPAEIQPDRESTFVVPLEPVPVYRTPAEIVGKGTVITWQNVYRPSLTETNPISVPEYWHHAIDGSVADNPGETGIGGIGSAFEIIATVRIEAMHESETIYELASLSMLSDSAPRLANGFAVDGFSAAIAASSVPEPASALAAGIGILGMAISARLRRSS